MKRVLVFLTGFKLVISQTKVTWTTYARNNDLEKICRVTLLPTFVEPRIIFFHVDITLANANHAYIALVTHMEMLSG